MEDLAWLHYRCHYGPESEASLLDDAKQAWRLLKVELVETHRLFDGAEA
jgi:hypothetical protein